MSHENVEIVRRTLDVDRRRDERSGLGFDATDENSVDAVLDSLHPEVEFNEDERFPEAGTYRGRDALKRYFTQFTESFDEFWFEAEDLVDLGDDRVLILVRLRTRGKGSGATVEQQSAWLSTIRDRKIVRMDAYLDRADALEAAGLEE